MRTIAISLLSLCSVAVSAAQEPVKPPLTPRIITATKQVSLFTGIEKQMLVAVVKKDRSTLESMLTDDCSIATPKSDAMDCGDWLDSVISRNFTLKSFSIRRMSVTDLGDSALVNYERTQQATFEGKDVSGEFFVLDLWKRSGDSWKLVNRYVSRVEAAASPTRPRPAGKE